MTKYFSIDRIKQAIEHLQNYDSDWVLIPLVFAVNGINTREHVSPHEPGKVGTDKFLEQYFHGQLIGLPNITDDRNSIRPRFKEVQAKSGDYIVHQSIKLWGNNYSSRGYREMESFVERASAGRRATYQLKPTFWEEWEKELPETFRFEELLIWLYAFSGFSDDVNSWEDLFVHFQEKHLGTTMRFEADYLRRFNVNHNVPWPSTLLSLRPSDEEFKEALLPSNYVAPGESRPFIDVAEEFSQSLFNCGITFGERHEEIVDRFLCSLVTKPFLILTGLSGSGKTQIAVKFGEWLGEDYHLLIPVRPDWTGGEAIFGYENALDTASNPSWFVPASLEFIIKANQNPNDPYLLILDEMNLAHVERYFGDFLSGLESRKPTIPNLQKGDDGKWRLKEDETHLIPLPSNLFVVGTVNIDETTYMFSPKVLDRANTIEFRVATEDLTHGLNKPIPCEPGHQGSIRTFLALSEDDQWQYQHTPATIEIYADKLRKLHEMLCEGGFEFGHRVFYEACRFFAFYGELGHDTWEEALDIQIMQKILPRLHGSQRVLGPTLRKVGAFCYNPIQFDDKTTTFDPLSIDVTDAVLKHSFAKVQRMYRNLMLNQYASFTE